MKDLKRKIHYWCSDTMQNKITGKGVVCAVLDTGITQHPDLVGRIVGWKDCVQGKKTIYDDNGHGTHVAGILAGNGKSGRGLYSGMAPEAQIFAVKVLNQRGGGKIRDVINGIRYVLLKQKEMKIRIGTAYPRKEQLFIDVKGRNLISGLPQALVVGSNEMIDALEEPLQSILESVRNLFERTPPELASDITENGICLTGGGALLYGMDKFISEHTKVAWSPASTSWSPPAPASTPSSPRMPSPAWPSARARRWRTWTPSPAAPFTITSGANISISSNDPMGPGGRWSGMGLG